MNRHSAVLLCAAAIALMCAPAASAATTRVVSPTGLNAAACTDAAPCDLPKAVVVADPGDTILVRAGTYFNVPDLVVADPDVKFVGEAGGPKPEIQLTSPFPAGSGISFPAGPGGVGGATGGEVRGLKIKALGGGSALMATARITVNDVDVESSGQCINLGGAGSSLTDAKLKSVAGPGLSPCLSASAAGATTTIRNVEVNANPAVPVFAAVIVGGSVALDQVVTSGAPPGSRWPAAPCRAASSRRSGERGSLSRTLWAPVAHRR